jgi:hypothetical protein
VYQVGLHVPLYPARALADPVKGFVVGFLVSGGVDDGNFVALCVSAYTKVGIFGYVKRIPCAKLNQFVQLKVVTGTTQGDGDIQGIQPGSI